MCGCEKHHDEQAECTCICPEHGNFRAAYDLAMQRYDVIKDLTAQLDEFLSHCTTEWGVRHANGIAQACSTEDIARRMHAASPDVWTVVQRQVTGWVEIEEAGDGV